MSNLTAKELQALRERLQCEQDLVRKCRAIAEQCGDVRLRNDFREYADKHQQHFNMLLTFLQ